MLTVQQLNEFIESISSITVEKLNSRKNKYYPSGRQIAPGDRLIPIMIYENYGTDDVKNESIPSRNMEWTIAHPEEINTVYTLIEDKNVSHSLFLWVTEIKLSPILKYLSL